MLVLGGCSAARSTGPESETPAASTRLTLAAPPEGTASAPAPAPDLGPKTPAERLALAHQEADIERLTPMPTLTASDIRRRAPPQSLETVQTRIQQLKRLIEEADPHEPEFPDLLFRLSESYVDLAAVFEAKADALAEDDRQRERLADQAKRARQSASKVYRALVGSPVHAKYARMDEVLFLYILQLGELGEEAALEGAALRLIREFPASPRVPYAYVIFGDHYLREERLPEAEKLYTKVVSQFSDSPVHPYALNELAWCHLMQGQEEVPGAVVQSLEEFSRVIERLGRGDHVLASAPRILEDAREGLAQAYVRAGDPRMAWTFIERFEGVEEQPRTIGRLALAYFRARKYRESIVLHRALLERHPDSPSGCEWQWWIFASVLADEDEVAIRRERTELMVREQRLDAMRAGSPELARCRSRVRDAQRVVLRGR